MLGGADNPNGELPSYITGADNSVHHIWCPLFSQEFQDLPDGAETTLTVHQKVSSIFFHPTCGRTTFLHRS